ncbi:hypothetical protein jhhlp_000416 [Lomentospora prolificans]|uniref:Indole-diterpene biosynthesis protein PaxU n=1 Tax=Lomentospora prolificans TaxID=41688 RepID=A0A2N3NKU7_9PEZI|nr:hypothetical protein jhhlp_000416 [Lomentospora prolificans]
MASNAPSPGGRPLDAFDKLSPNAIIYIPKETPPPDPSSPKLIAMFVWMAAQDAHIAKYVVGYQSLYPSSPILIVKAPLENMLRLNKARTEVGPVVPAMKAILGDSISGGDDQPELLLHIFSNGGCYTFGHFYKLFMSKSDGGEAPRFPRHVSAMDSCPTQFNWRRTHKALSQPLPKWMGPLVHLLVLVLLLYYAFSARKTADGGKVGKEMNSNEMIEAGRRRVYLFSDADEMVAAKDVKEHAAEAKEKGLDVRLENFGSSPHVAHMRTDGKRYWSAIKDVWDGWQE